MPRIRAGTIEAHRELVRKELLDAAERLIQTLGYEGASLADIAAEAGVARTTIYEYFSDKEDLLASLVETTLPDTIEAILEELSPGSPIERLCELATRTIEFVALDPTLGLILHREVSKLSQPTQERVAASHENLAHEFASLYREAVAREELRFIPPDLAGRFIQDLIMSAARALIASEDPATRIEEVTGAAVEFLLNGLKR